MNLYYLKVTLSLVPLKAGLKDLETTRLISPTSQNVPKSLSALLTVDTFIDNSFMKGIKLSTNNPYQKFCQDLAKILCKIFPRSYKNLVNMQDSCLILEHNLA